MKLGMVGMGRMGGNMVERLRRAGHVVETYARTNPARTATSLIDLVGEAGAAACRLADDPCRRRRPSTPSTTCSSCSRTATSSSTAATRTSPTPSGAPRWPRRQGINFVDAGVSGGVWGLENGYCVMVGGKPEIVAQGRAALPRPGAEGRLRARRRERRRALHEDGPQRHRVRDDAVLRRGLRDHAGLGVRDRPAHRGEHLALRLGRAQLAARAARDRARRRIPAWPRSPATSRTPARAAGRFSPRSTRACRRRSSPAPCSPASPRARTSRSRPRSTRRSETSSAGTR